MLCTQNFNTFFLKNQKKLGSWRIEGLSEKMVYYLMEESKVSNGTKLFLTCTLIQVRTDEYLVEEVIREFKNSNV